MEGQASINDLDADELFDYRKRWERQEAQKNKDEYLAKRYGANGQSVSDPHDYEKVEGESLVETMGEAEAYDDLTTLMNSEEALSKRLASNGFTGAETARMLAYAEYSDSALAAAKLTDILLDKMVEYEAAFYNPNDATEDNQQRSDNLWNRFMAVKDREHRRLQNGGERRKTYGSNSNGDNVNENEDSELKLLPEFSITHIDEPVTNTNEAANGAEPEQVVSPEQLSAGQVVRYDPEEDGRVQLGVEYNEPGTLINLETHELAKGPGSRILLRGTNGTLYYIRGNQLNNLTQSEEQGRLASLNFEKFSPIVIGQGWQVGASVTEPIVRVIMRYRVTHLDEEHLETTTAAGPNPFNAAEDMLRSIASQAGQDIDALSAEDAQAQKRFSRAQLAGYYALAGAKVRQAYENTYSYFTDEKDGRRRRRVAAAAIGALVAGGLLYLALKGGSTEHPHKAPTHTGTEPNAQTPPAKQPSGAGVEHHVAKPHHENISEREEYRTARLYKGDTIWHEASEQLRRGGNRNPSNLQIWNRTDHILRMNHISWEQARHLFVGTKIRLY
jgi:hypothetical protein